MTGLKAENLVKSYNGRQVVKGINININEGEIVGLLGPNGAGKTTTFYMIVGLVRHEEGRIFLGEDEITNYPMFKRARKGITYLPQEPSVFRKMTVEENILAVLETLGLDIRKRRKRLAELLDELNISHLYKNMAYTLSGGERRRVEITRALATSPRFMLLDEPFTGIDPISINDIQNIIKQLSSKGIGILVSDHNVRDTLSVCNRAYIVNEGDILEEGNPEHIANSEKAREIYLGEKFRL